MEVFEKVFNQLDKGDYRQRADDIQRVDSNEILNFPIEEINNATLDEVEKLWPSIIIRMLDKLGCEFKREQFDRFFEHITYDFNKDMTTRNDPKNDPFLVRLDNTHNIYVGYRNNCINECIKLMLNKFDLTKKQMKSVIDCYKNNGYNKNQCCLKILVEKGYTFDSSEKRVLLTSGVFKPFSMKPKELDADDILCVLKNKSTYLKLDNLEKGLTFVFKVLDNSNKLPVYNIFDNFLDYVVKSRDFILTKKPQQKLIIILLFIEKLVEEMGNGPKICNETLRKLFRKYVDMVVLYENDAKKEGVDLVGIFTKGENSYKLDLDDVRYICDGELDFKFTYELLENGSVELAVDIIIELIENYFWIFIESREYDDYEESLKLIRFAEDRDAPIASDMVDGRILKTVCQYDTKSDCMEYLLTQYGMFPDNGCLNSCLMNYINVDNDDVLIYILNQGITPDYGALETIIETFEGMNNDSNDSNDSNDPNDDEHLNRRIELLIYYGLTISKFEMKLLIENSIELDNLDRFDVEFDNEVYYWCFKQNFMPDGYYDKFAKSLGAPIIWFRYACSNSDISLDKLIEYLKEHSDLKPDRYCIENLYWSRPNADTNYFLDRGCKPTPSCLLGDKQAKNSRVLDIINDEMGITPEKMGEPFKDFKLD